MNRIFDKTDKGREEIATRKFRLAPRLRTLLLLIDGKQSTEHLLQKIAGLDEQSIDELRDSGFIQRTDADASLTEAAASSSETRDGVDNPVSPEANPASDALHQDSTPFQSLYNFYTETIRTMIGLRGYALQQKVDQATSSADFLALRDPYYTAVQKAKGDDIAASCCAKLDQLLAAATPPVDPSAS